MGLTKTLIEKEVTTKTIKLNEALESKEILLQEVHHRVKNNLQIILLMVQLQQSHDKNEPQHPLLIDLENRINTIAKNYEMLIISNSLEDVDMQPYITHLLKDIDESFSYLNYNIQISIDISVLLPIKESVYLGLIINEITTNAYKYAFPSGNGNIVLILKKDEASYILDIQDNGIGFMLDKKQSSLGISLIYALSEEQLQGKLTLHHDKGTHYQIVF